MVPGVVLAGGASSRMGGRPKALLRVGSDQETFLERIVSTLLSGGVDDVVVVTGYHDEVIKRVVDRMSKPVRLVQNPSPELGQLSSLLAALKAIDHPGVRAMLVTLVDLPLLSAHTVRALLEAYRRNRSMIVRPVRAGRHGHPVIFDRALFKALSEARPQYGAKPVVRDHLDESIEVEVDDEGAFLDVDTPADYERMFGGPPLALDD
ncbi:MAG: hypothetical protein CL484_06300 [Acidobacteria bacterium]|nr:hypothetical protein [Acidobacteriota bacterium]